MESIKSQEHWVLQRLEKFYANEDNLNKVRDILTGKSPLSLRLIDWFVTNYSKKFNCGIITQTGKHLIVYLAYKSHLKAYSKKMFDPFCRCKRIKYKEINTTVGQLNFFEWVITDNILDFILLHRETIHQDMESRIQENKDTLPIKKRHELSLSATNTISKHDVPVKVSFD